VSLIIESLPISHNFLASTKPVQLPEPLCKRIECMCKTVAPQSRSNQSRPDQEKSECSQGSEDQKKPSKTNHQRIENEDREEASANNSRWRSTLDVPHTIADLRDHVVALIRVAQRNKRSDLGRQGRTGLRRAWLGTTDSSTNSGILTSLLTLLATLGTFRGRGRLMSTSAVGCQVCVVDSRD